MTNAKRLELIKANYPKYREGLLNGEVDKYTPYGTEVATNPKRNKTPYVVLSPGSIQRNPPLTPQ